MDAINVLSKYLRLVSCSCAHTKSSLHANEKGVGKQANG